MIKGAGASLQGDCYETRVAFPAGFCHALIVNCSWPNL